MRCPFCGSPDVEDVSQWGGQLLTRQVRCRTCHTYFEAVRDDFAEPQEARARRGPGGPPPPRAA